MKNVILWRWLSVAILIVYMYVANFYAHLMSIELDGGVQAILTFVMLPVTYYTMKLVWKKLIKSYTK